MTYYNKYGKECTKEDAVAYKTDKAQYIHEYLGALRKITDVVTQRNRDMLKFVKVGPQCFKNYLRYLTSNIDAFYHIAKRNIKD